MSKSVTWKISPRERLIRSVPVIKTRSRREQPTWSNCKKERPIKDHHAIRPTSSMTPSTVSSRSIYKLSLLSTSDATSEVQRGREVFRKKAISHLRHTFPSKFVKFDASDLKTKTKPSSGRSQSAKKYSDAANAVVEAEKSRYRVYIFNGVPSRAYRRPSIQFGDKETPSVRRSEPVVSTYIGAESNHSPEIPPPIPVRPSSATPSTSAPATIASNDETIKSKESDEDREYLKRDWKSDILSRYAKAEPWTPKYRTNRYFPKHGNLQDLHCKNPYLIPNGLLYDTNNG